MAKNENTKNKGLATPATNPKTHKLNFNDNSTFNQRLKLLDWLLEHGSITTDQARQQLDIMHPQVELKT